MLKNLRTKLVINPWTIWLAIMGLILLAGLIVGIFVFVTVPLEFLWFLFLVLDNGLNALGIAPNESAAHVIDTIQRYLISLGAVLLVIAIVGLVAWGLVTFLAVRLAILSTQPR